MDLVPDEIQGLIPDFVDENNENFDISMKGVYRDKLQDSIL